MRLYSKKHQQKTREKKKDQPLAGLIVKHERWLLQREFRHQLALLRRQGIE